MRNSRRETTLAESLTLTPGSSTVQILTSNEADGSTAGAWTVSRSSGNVLTAETRIVSARLLEGWNMPGMLLRLWGIRGNQ